MTAALFDFAEFNEAEFNEEELSNRFTLFLNPDGANIQVGQGAGFDVPAAMLYPGSEYLIRLESEDGCTIEMRFRTPPAINYDGMGG